MNMSYFNQYQLPTKSFEAKEDNYEDDVKLITKSILQYKFDYLKEEEINTIENELFNNNDETKLIKESDLLIGKDKYLKLKYFIRYKKKKWF